MKKITLSGMNFNEEVSLDRNQLKNVLGGATADGTDDPSGCGYFQCTCDGTVGTWTNYYCSIDEMTAAIERNCSTGQGGCTNIG